MSSLIFCVKSKLVGDTTVTLPPSTVVRYSVGGSGNAVLKALGVYRNILRNKKKNNSNRTLT